MNNAVNTFLTCLLVALSSGSLAAQDLNVQLLLPSKMSPEDYPSLSKQDKVNTLSHIAESSGQLLVRVPKKGLRNSKPNLEAVIATRKWLEKTNDLVARMLATRLQFVVDSCILNEIYRAEKYRLQLPLASPFEPNSFDKNLIQMLLAENAIDEEEHITFALSQETEIGNFCRENNYSAQDFITGKVFDEAAEHMRLSPPNPTGGNGKIAKPSRLMDIRKATIIRYVDPIFIESRKMAAQWLLPMILDEADQARDVRLVASLYRKHGNLVNKNKGRQKDPIRSDVFINRLKVELPGDRKSHIRLSKKSLRLFVVMDVQKRISARIEKETGYYNRIMVSGLMPFFNNVEMLPTWRRSRLKKRGLGKWLDLVE